MGNNVEYLFHPMVDKRTNFPNRIRELRLAAGRTLVDIAEEVGISYQMLGFIERGLRDMTFSHQKAIAQALGVQPADLLNPSDHSIVLTQDEKALLGHYRQLDARGRHTVRGVAESMTVYTPEPTVPADERKRA